jgi:phage-related protein
VAIEEVLRIRDEASAALKRLEKAADSAAREFDDLDDQARKAAGGVKAAGQAATTNTASIAKMAAGHAAGALTVGALTGAVQAVGRAMLDSALFASDFADRMIIMARTTGLSTESVVGLSYAAQAGGGDITQLRTGLTAFLTVAQQAATGSDAMAERLARVGVVATDAGGALRSMDELLREALGGIAALPSETERAAAAIDLFGARGAQLVAVLGDGSGALDDWTARAKEAGVVITDDVAAASAQADEALAQFRLTLDSLKLALGVEIIPLLTTFAETFKTLAPIVRIALKPLVDQLRGIGLVIDGIVTAVQTLGKAFGDLPDNAGIRDHLRALGDADVALGESLRKFLTEGPAGGGAPAGPTGGVPGAAGPVGLPGLPALSKAVEEAAKEIDDNARLIARAARREAEARKRANDSLEQEAQREAEARRKAAAAANEAALRAATVPAGPSGVETATAALGAIQGGLSSILSALGPEGALAAAIIQVVSNPAEVLSGIVAEVDALVEGLLVELIPALLDAIPALVDTLLVKLPELIPQFIQQLVTLIPTLISGLVQALPAILVGLIQALPEILAALFNGLVENLATLFVKLPVLFAKAIGEAFKNLFRFGKKRNEEAVVQPEEMSFAAGGRVDRTGMALVHRGERIIPPSGVGSQASERARSTAGGGGGTTINVSGVIAQDIDAFVRQLRRHLRGRNLDLGVT